MQYQFERVRKLYRDYCLLGRVGEEGGCFHMGAHSGLFIKADLQSQFIPTIKEPDSSCVVAIKMKSLYFVTLKNFLYLCLIYQ